MRPGARPIWCYSAIPVGVLTPAGGGGAIVWTPLTASNQYFLDGSSTSFSSGKTFSALSTGASGRTCVGIWAGFVQGVITWTSTAGTVTSHVSVGPGAGGCQMGMFSVPTTGSTADFTIDSDQNFFIGDLFLALGTLENINTTPTNTYSDPPDFASSSISPTVPSSGIAIVASWTDDGGTHGGFTDDFGIANQNGGTRRFRAGDITASGSCTISGAASGMVGVAWGP